MVVLGGDHIYNMNYAIMLADHVAKGRECTVACIEIPGEEASAFGVMAVDEQWRILDFAEKPPDPPCIPGSPTRSLVSNRLIAGGDAVLVPSRFEPCGLTQLYGLRYGALPVVRRTGGLADTVVDAGDEQGTSEAGTGFCFDAASGGELATAMQRAVRCYRQPARWRALVQRAMAQDFSWRESARLTGLLYEELRDSALQDQRTR